MEQISVEKQFAKLLIALRRIRPFYASVFEVIDKVEKVGFGTVGVTENSLIYDPIFIQTTEFSELLFIMLHEIAHIALQHVARAEGKNQEIWNIAADLYVNSVLMEEFNISNIGNKVNVQGYEIKAPLNMYHSSSIDTDKDYVEKIYYSLQDQAEDNGYSQSQDGGYSYQFTYTGSISAEPFSASIQKGSNTRELMSNGDKPSKYESDKLISEALTRYDMSSNYVGDGTGSIVTKVRKLLESELDWKKLLSRYLRKSTEHDISYKTPDRRMYYQSVIYPGQSPGDLNEIPQLSVCIDTSLSMSDKDLEIIFGQVFKLLKQYKVAAELVYWDSQIKSRGEFTRYTEFERIDCTGGGGTNPECIFKYFDAKKKKPIVNLIFTDGYLPDRWHTKAYKKKYKDTIWIMTKNYNREFKPPFGKLAVAKFN